MQAALFIRKEKSYLARNNRRAAAAVSVQMKKAIALIAEYPKAGPVAAPVDGIRRFVSAPYHLDYQELDDMVLIVAIRHGRQRLSDLDKDADDPQNAD